MGNPIGYNGSNLPLRGYTQICSLVSRLFVAFRDFTDNLKEICYTSSNNIIFTRYKSMYLLINSIKRNFTIIMPTTKNTLYGVIAYRNHSKIQTRNTIEMLVLSK